MIFLHVDNLGDTGKGTIFTSDESGTRFTKSLENHFFPNGQDDHDFHRIKSLEGVYFTSQEQFHDLFIQQMIIPTRVVLIDCI